MLGGHHTQHTAIVLAMAPCHAAIDLSMDPGNATIVDALWFFHWKAHNFQLRNRTNERLTTS